MGVRLREKEGRRPGYQDMCCAVRVGPCEGKEAKESPEAGLLGTTGERLGEGPIVCKRDQNIPSLRCPADLVQGRVNLHCYPRVLWLHELFHGTV